MRIEKIICNRCKKDIDLDSIESRNRFRAINCIGDDATTWDIDLCSKCGEDFLKIFLGKEN